MTNPAPLTDLREQLAQVRQETGARVIALGEDHNYAGHVKALRRDFAGLKADGYTSLYLEIGADQQPLIDRALGGDPVAQRDLRLKYERWLGFYGGTEVAQQRYDMLFDAKKAGLRVLCVDMDDAMDHMERFNQIVEDETDQILSARLAIGDNRMSENIRRLDDGGLALFMVGKAHTYNAAPGGHLEYRGTPQEEGYYQSQLGGADQRLNALGIKTASVDMLGVKSGAGTLSRDDGRSGNYLLTVPEEKYTGAGGYHVSTGYRVYWDRLANIYDHAIEIDKARGSFTHVAGFKKIADDLRGLSTLLDSSDFNRDTPANQEQRLTKAIESVNKRVLSSLEILPDQVHVNGAYFISALWLTPKGPDYPDNEAVWRNIIDDNRILQLPDARTMWQRPAAVPELSAGQGRDIDLVMARLVPQTAAAPSPPQRNQPAPEPVLDVAP